MFLIGQKVQIVAADDFFAFVDGWRGNVTGYNSGQVEVTCIREDGPKVFYVPEGQLAPIK